MHRYPILIIMTLASAAFAIDPPAGGEQSKPPGPHKDKGDMERMMLEKFDANKDGKLDESERAAAKAAWEARQGEHGEEMFKRIDANSDGMISKDEWTTAWTMIKQRREGFRDERRDDHKEKKEHKKPGLE